jgi:hypothetical protein
MDWNEGRSIHVFHRRFEPLVPRYEGRPPGEVWIDYVTRLLIAILFCAVPLFVLAMESSESASTLGPLCIFPALGLIVAGCATRSLWRYRSAGEGDSLRASQRFDAATRMPRRNRRWARK